MQDLLVEFIKSFIGSQKKKTKKKLPKPTLIFYYVRVNFVQKYDKYVKALRNSGK